MRMRTFCCDIKKYRDGNITFEDIFTTVTFLEATEETLISMSRTIYASMIPWPNNVGHEQRLMSQWRSIYSI